MDKVEKLRRYAVYLQKRITGLCFFVFSLHVQDDAIFRKVTDKVHTNMCLILNGY